MKRNAWLGGAALVALGAIGAVAVSHVHVTFGNPAKASPAVSVPANLPPPTPAQVSDARALSRTFAQVASQLSPSVVRITSSKTVKMQRSSGVPFFFGGPPSGGRGGQRFDPFNFGDDDDDQQQPRAMPKQRGEGSGVVIDQRGYILTNNHVVGGADELKVTFYDGKTLPAKIVGTDPKTDLAVIRVEGAKDLKTAKLGDSDKLMVGEWVVAIGNPFGLDHTVTVGVLSAKGRSGINVDGYEDFLQTDASINPGNSGGPLVDLDGEVIGINTAIYGPGGNIGIGFAVPTSIARNVAEQLIAGGKVRRPFLGIHMQDVTPELHKGPLAAAPERGVVVADLGKDSPAAKAGVKQGDVIVAIDGKSVENGRAVQREVFSKKIGQRIDLAVWRDGKEMKLLATTAEMPGEDAESPRAGRGGDRDAAKARLGLALQSLTPELAERLDVRGVRSGAVVAGVKPGSVAAEAGLREGDVIVEVDRSPVRGADDANRALSAGSHLLRVLRGGMSLFLPLP
jgi:serine protease Do